MIVKRKINTVKEVQDQRIGALFHKINNALMTANQSESSRRVLSLFKRLISRQKTNFAKIVKKNFFTDPPCNRSPSIGSNPNFHLLYNHYSFCETMSQVFSILIPINCIYLLLYSSMTCHLISTVEVACICVFITTTYQ